MITRARIRRSFIWLCLPLGALGIAGYVVSFLGPVSYDWAGDRRLDAGRGAAVLSWIEIDPGSWMVAYSPLQPDPSRRWRWMPRLGTHSDALNPSAHVGYLVLPYWVLLAIGAVGVYYLLPPGFPRGRCAKCGYDTRGLPAVEGVVKCPECGEVHR